MAKYQTTLTFENKDYAERWASITSNHGGYDITTNAFSPLRNVQKLVSGNENEAMAGVQFLLDNVAAASELGVYSTDIEDLISKCFESREDFDTFASSLDLYSIWWVNERHYSAFYGLRGEDYGIRTYEEIGETLRVLAE